MDEKVMEALLEAMWEASERTRKNMGAGIPVLISTNVPRELLQPFIQLVRTWDVEHGMDSAIGVLGGLPRDELLQLFAGIVPPFPFTEERTV